MSRETDRSEPLSKAQNGHLAVVARLLIAAIVVAAVGVMVSRKDATSPPNAAIPVGSR